MVVGPEESPCVQIEAIDVALVTDQANAWPCRAQADTCEHVPEQASAEGIVVVNAVRQCPEVTLMGAFTLEASPYKQVYMLASHDLATWESIWANTL